MMPYTPEAQELIEKREAEIKRLRTALDEIEKANPIAYAHIGSQGQLVGMCKKLLGYCTTPLYLHPAPAVTSGESPDPNDTARINWLEMNPRNAEIVVDGEIQPCLYYAVAGAFGVRLRDIIDAAMKDIGGK